MISKSFNLYQNTGSELHQAYRAAMQSVVEGKQLLDHPQCPQDVLVRSTDVDSSKVMVGKDRAEGWTQAVLRVGRDGSEDFEMTTRGVTKMLPQKLFDVRTSLHRGANPDQVSLSHTDQHGYHKHFDINYKTGQVQVSDLVAEAEKSVYRSEHYNYLHPSNLHDVSGIAEMQRTWLKIDESQPVAAENAFHNKQEPLPMDLEVHNDKVHLSCHRDHLNPHLLTVVDGQYPLRREFTVNEQTGHLRYHEHWTC